MTLKNELKETLRKAQEILEMLEEDGDLAEEDYFRCFEAIDQVQKITKVYQ